MIHALILVVFATSLPAHAGVKTQIAECRKSLKEKQERDAAQKAQLATKLDRENCPDCGAQLKPRRECGFPFAYACEKQDTLLDSQCRFLSFASDDNLAATPESEQTLKDLDAAYQTHCQDFEDQDCFRKNQAAIKEKQYKAIYTDRRIAALSGLFAKVKARYAKLIARSANISDGAKKALFKHLDKVSLLSDDLKSRGALCGVPMRFERGQPLMTGAYNWDPQIEICSGLAANVDNVNPYMLAAVMAHEITHSIGFCNGAAITGEAANPFAKSVACLRGGKGKDHCDGAVMRCGTCDTNDRSGSHSQFEHGNRRAQKQFDQMEEGLADFNGATVVADLIKTDFDGGVIDETGRKDALRAVTASFGGLPLGPPGDADKGKTTQERCENLEKDCSSVPYDPYLPGCLRVSHGIFSSKPFRESAGCTTGTTSTAVEKQTCEAF